MLVVGRTQGKARVQAYERLEDYLAYVLEIANEIKYNSEPYSQERRAMMAVTAEIESALDTVNRQRDRSLKEAYHA